MLTAISLVASVSAAMAAQGDVTPFGFTLGKTTHDEAVEIIERNPTEIEEPIFKSGLTPDHIGRTSKTPLEIIVYSGYEPFAVVGRGADEPASFSRALLYFSAEETGSKLCLLTAWWQGEGAHDIWVRMQDAFKAKYGVEPVAKKGAVSGLDLDYRLNNKVRAVLNFDTHLDQLITRVTYVHEPCSEARSKQMERIQHGVAKDNAGGLTDLM